MRIAIYHELPSGGAKRLLYELARRLAQSHELDAYTLSPADVAFCDLRPVVRRHVVIPFQPRPLFHSPLGRLNQLQRWRDLQSLDRINRRTATEIDGQGYHAVYAHPSQYTQAPNILNFLATPSVYQANEPLRLAYEADIRRPYHNHGWRERVDRFDPWLRLYRGRLREVDRRNVRRATLLLAISRFTAGNLRRIYGGAPEVIYPGIDLNVFQPPRQRARQNFLLSVGALRPNKGFDFLIAALAQLPSELRPPLRVIGNADDPLERGYLVSQAQRMQVNLVIETGVDEATLLQNYQETAFVIYAPINEPLGFVPLEAAACGTPTVAVAEGGVRETVVPNVTGILTQRDPAEFAAAVRSLLGDGARRDRLGQDGRAWVEANWTWDHALAGVEAALARVRAEPRAPVQAAAGDQIA